MRLRKFWIESYKNLQDFRIDFDDPESITVLVGRNGSAKSNVLESLAHLFSMLMVGSATDFPRFNCSVEYVLGEQTCELEYRFEGRPKVKLNGHSISVARLREAKPAVLPRRVVVYYSGESDRYAPLARRWDRIAWEQTAHSDHISLRQVFYAQPIHAKFAALSYFAKKDGPVQSFLKQWFGIERFDSALFVLNRPPWAKRGSTSETFWNAAGESSEVMSRLLRHSMAPFTESLKVDVDFDQKEKKDFLYLYLASQTALEGAVGSQTASEFFQSLDTLRLSRLINDLRIRVHVRGADRSLYTRDLSEGEIQLLSVIGLMRFTRKDESLYLLDEPDTHLNPYWGLHYLNFLHEVGDADKLSHTVLATHDPLLVAGLTKEQIRILYRDAQSGHVKSIAPFEDPRGKGVAAALTSELFGLDSQLDVDTNETLEKRRQLAAKENLTPEELKALDGFNDELRNLGYVEAYADPRRNEVESALYRFFEEHRVNAREFSPEEILRRRELAQQVIKEIEQE